MTEKQFEDQSLAQSVSKMLAAMSADDFKAWFLRGFREMVQGDAASHPFGEVRFAYPAAEDITDALAFAFFELKALKSLEEDNPFTKGLLAAFRKLSIREDGDRRMLIHILRLSAKINYSRLLPHISAKLFRKGDDASVDEKKLRSVALDVAIELSGESPDAVEALHDIIHSNLFRPSAARTIFLALCGAAPQDLLAHLFCLEEPLARIYSDERETDTDALWTKRSLFVADILRFSQFSTVYPVAEFCLCNRGWSLAWIGEVSVSPRLFERLEPVERQRLQDLYNSLGGRNVVAISAPRWKRDVAAPPTVVDNKRNTNILLSADTTPEEEEQVRQSVLTRLAGGKQTSGIDQKFLSQIIEDNPFGSAA